MNPDELMRAFGEISDKYITEALVDEENGGFLEETDVNFDDCLTDILAEFSETEGESNIKTLEIPSREIIEIPEETESEDGSDGGEEFPGIITLEKKTKFKKLASVAIIVICFGMILTSFNFIAKAYGVDTIAILREFGDRIVEMFVGEKVEYKGITIMKGDKSTKYYSMEEFLKEEKLSSLYPSKLPENVNLSFVNVWVYCKEKTHSDCLEVDYVTDSEETRVSFKTCPNAYKDFLTNQACQHKVINGIDCYFSYGGIFIQCNFIYKNYVYNVTTATEADAILIIENLKETES